MLQFHVVDSGHRVDALSRTCGHYGDLVLPGMCTPGVAMCVFDASLCTTGECRGKECNSATGNVGLSPAQGVIAGQDRKLDVKQGMPQLEGLYGLWQ